MPRHASSQTIWRRGTPQCSQPSRWSASGFAGGRGPRPRQDPRQLNRDLVFELATGRFIAQREDALFRGLPGTGKSHFAAAERLIEKRGYLDNSSRRK
jgi:hypothetical protein